MRTEEFWLIVALQGTKKRQNSGPQETAEKRVRDIRRATRKKYSTEDKNRIVLSGLRWEYLVAELYLSRRQIRGVSFALEGGLAPMSDDLSIPLASSEPGGDAVEVRRYRLDFRHAIALLCAVVLLLLGTSALCPPGNGCRMDAEVRAVASEGLRPAHPRPSTEPVDEPKAAATPNLWTRTKRFGTDLLAGLKRAVKETVRRQNAAILTKALFETDMGDPREARAFLAAHKNNQYTEELGYIGAQRDERFPSVVTIGATTSCHAASPGVSESGRSPIAMRRHAVDRADKPRGARTE